MTADYANIGSSSGDAGWSSPVARWAHNPKVAGSNPAPATTEGRETKGVGRDDRPAPLAVYERTMKFSDRVPSYRRRRLSYDASSPRSCARRRLYGPGGRLQQHRGQD